MSRTKRATLEVCVDTVAGLRACQSDVDRIELCSALALGGLTPPPGLIAAAQESAVPVHVLIRPRGGGFTYSGDEIAQCVADIEAVKAAGLAGVVIGAARDGALDGDALKVMIEAASGLETTLHRVIDTLADPVAALEVAVALGVSRILTSGAAPKAIDGVAMLRKLQEAADGRITVMAGSGVTADTAPLIAATGIRAFHASCCREVVQSAIDQRFGFAPKVLRETDRNQIIAMRRVIDALD